MLPRPPLPHDEPRRTPVFPFFHFETHVDAALQLFHMGDDADEAAAFLEIHESFYGEVEGFGVESTEAFVDEDGVEADAAGVAGDDIERRHVLEIIPPTKMSKFKTLLAMQEAHAIMAGKMEAK